MDWTTGLPFPIYQYPTGFYDCFSVEEPCRRYIYNGPIQDFFVLRFLLLLYFRIASLNNTQLSFRCFMGEWFSPRSLTIQMAAAAAVNKIQSHSVLHVKLQFEEWHCVVVLPAMHNTMRQVGKTIENQRLPPHSVQFEKCVLYKRQADQQQQQQNRKKPPNIVSPRIYIPNAHIRRFSIRTPNGLLYYIIIK